MYTLSQQNIKALHWCFGSIPSVICVLCEQSRTLQSVCMFCASLDIYCSSNGQSPLYSGLCRTAMQITELRVIKHVALAEADSHPCPWKMSSKSTKSTEYTNWYHVVGIKIAPEKKHRPTIKARNKNTIYGQSLVLFYDLRCKNNAWWRNWVNRPNTWFWS